MLDAGHGGSDPGAGSSAGWEAPATLAIAKKVQQKLQSAGAAVIMTRSGDSYVSLETRRDAIRSKKPDLKYVLRPAGSAISSSTQFQQRHGTGNLQ